MPSSMGKGGVCASDKMRRFKARISIWPVAIFSLMAPPRFSTRPVTAITNSLLSVPAFSKPSVPISFSSKTNCNRPERSRRSTKIKLPRFLLFWTQPMTVTCSPMCALDTSVHRCVRCKPFIDSAIISSKYTDRSSCRVTPYVKVGRFAFHAPTPGLPSIRIPTCRSSCSYRSGTI